MTAIDSHLREQLMALATTDYVSHELAMIAANAILGRHPDWNPLAAFPIDGIGLFTATFIKTGKGYSAVYRWVLSNVQDTEFADAVTCKLKVYPCPSCIYWNEIGQPHCGVNPYHEIGTSCKDYEATTTPLQLGSKSC